jgi:hypothetical protein
LKEKFKLVILSNKNNNKTEFYFVTYLYKHLGKNEVRNISTTSPGLPVSSLQFAPRTIPGNHPSVGPRLVLTGLLLTSRGSLSPLMCFRSPSTLICVKD